jgi:hypothetical protein
MFLQNLGICLQVHTASQPRRPVTTVYVHGYDLDRLYHLLLIHSHPDMALILYGDVYTDKSHESDDIAKTESIGCCRSEAKQNRRFSNSERQQIKTL